MDTLSVAVVCFTWLLLIQKDNCNLNFTPSANYTELFSSESSAFFTLNVSVTAPSETTLNATEALNTSVEPTFDNVTDDDTLQDVKHHGKERPAHHSGFFQESCDERTSAANGCRALGTPKQRRFQRFPGGRCEAFSFPFPEHFVGKRSVTDDSLRSSFLSVWSEYTRVFSSDQTLKHESLILTTSELCDNNVVVKGTITCERARVLPVETIFVVSRTASIKTHLQSWRR